MHAGTSQTVTVSPKTTKPSRPKWHMLYFVLAAFDLATICLSLYLSHTILGIYTNSVEVNHEWVTRRRSYSALRSLASEVNAPGNDIFDSLNVPKEQARLAQALRAYQAHLETIENEVRTHVVPETARSLDVHFDSIRDAMNEMLSEARSIFAYFAEGEAERAGERMATMDRKYAQLNKAIGRLENQVDTIQESLFATQTAAARSLSQYEYLVAALIIVIVVSVALYGHKMAKNVADHAREIETYYNELKQSQMRLIQSEKMSALGQMVAGVAHEINTPLAYSRGSVAYVHEQWPTLVTLLEQSSRQAELLADADVDATALRKQLTVVADLARTLHEEEVLTDMGDLLATSLTGLDQISEMVTTLKDFSRLDRKKVDRVNLNEGLDRALLIAQNTLKYKVEVVKRYGALPLVTCAPSQINQVFLNLLVNAAQAISDSGTITLTTRATREHVEVLVEDTGQGIPADIMPHIFEPFYTTKDVGAGTGLGLSISYQIIEQHAGTMSVTSTVGQGTRFTLKLPLDQTDTTRLAKM